tara:strand:- start:27399 stop:27803 length:405 start_codon:yes stop_codon:yes gene_type:complete
MHELYEAFLDDIMTGVGDEVDKKKSDINVKDVETAHKRFKDEKVKDTDSNYNDGKVPLSPEFVSKLVAYIDSLFPTETQLGNSVGHELRKVVKVGDGKEFQKAKNKVRDLVYKEKMKMFDKINKRVSSVLVEPR